VSKKKHSRRRKKRPRQASPQKPAPPKISKKTEPASGAKLRKFWIMLAAAVVVAVGLVLLITTPSDQVDYSSVIKNKDLNVVLITLDTTRADRLGCYGYPQAKTPNLDLLAQNGVRFANAYCQVPLQRS